MAVSHSDSEEEWEQVTHKKQKKEKPKENPTAESSSLSSCKTVESHSKFVIKVFGRSKEHRDAAVEYIYQQYTTSVVEVISKNNSKFATVRFVSKAPVQELLEKQYYSLLILRKVNGFF